MIHTWRADWGRWGLSSGFVLNITDTTLVVDNNRYARRALGDPNLSPIMVTYNADTVHVLMAAHMWIRIGDYKVENPASPGLNYWTGAMELAVTWLPSAMWEVSVDSFTQVNSENSRTRYHSGSDFDLDYIVGWRPLTLDRRLQLGVVGYAYKQWSNDRSQGLVVPGARGQVVSVGAQIRWDVLPHGGLLAKWQHEMDVRNRPRGDRLWIELAVGL